MKAKHAPSEISSKVRVPKIRNVVEGSHKNEARDPRFESVSGSLNEDLYRKSYGFVQDLRAQSVAEVKREIESLAALMRRMEGNWGLLDDDEQEKYYAYQEKEAQLRKQLQRDSSRLETQRNKDRDAEAIRKWKHEERERQGQGKKAFYLSGKAKKDLLLKEQYEALSKDKRKLRKTMEKQRRKADQKEKKKMPTRRA